MVDDPRESAGWMVLIRDESIVWNPDAQTPLKAGDIWVFRCEEQYLLGIYSDPIKNEHSNRLVKLTLGFFSADGAYSLIKALRYLLGETHVRDD